MTRKVTLEGMQPYTRQPVVIDIEVIDQLPGKATTTGKASAHQRRDPDYWTALAGPFRLDMAGGVFEPDRQPMMGLVWDLEGYPIHPGHRRRPRATYVIVEESRGMVNIYRKATEMHDSYEVEPIGPLVTA